METSTYKIISFPGPIQLIQTDQQLQNCCERISQASLLGFDTETRPAFKKGQVYQVALLQLATESEAYVIRLHGLQRFDLIRPIFENQSIVKVGLAIKEDIRQLQKRFQFIPENFIDLQTLAKTKGLQNMGLKGMTEEVLGATITKGPKTTNWEAAELTDRQILYAATDAWISLKLFQQLHAVKVPNSEN